MSKSIKVSEKNYGRIQALMRPRETYDDVITRLLATHEQAFNLLNVMEGSISFRQRQLERLGYGASADAVRRDVEARTIPTDLQKTA